MAYGLEIHNGGGAVRLSVTHRITRVLYTRYLPAAESSSVSVAGFDSSKGVAFGVKHKNVKGVPHKLTITGSTIAWEPWPDIQTCDAILIVVMYG